MTCQATHVLHFLDLLHGLECTGAPNQTSLRPCIKVYIKKAEKESRAGKFQLIDLPHGLQCLVTTILDLAQTLHQGARREGRQKENSQREQVGSTGGLREDRIRELLSTCSTWVGDQSSQRGVDSDASTQQRSCCHRVQALRDL